MNTYHIGDRVSLRTNAAKHFDIPSALSGKHRVTDRSLTVERTSDIVSDSSLSTRCLADHTVNHGADRMIVTYPSDPSKGQVQMMLSGLDSSATTVLRYSPAFAYHADVNCIYESVLTSVALSADIVPIHAAGVVIGGETVIITSIGRMGKTSTILELAHHADAFLGDNMLFLTATADVLAWPVRVSIYPGTSNAEALLPRVKQWRFGLKQRIGERDLLAAALTKLFNAQLCERVRPSSVAPVVKKSSVDAFYVLNSGDKDTRELATHEAVRKAITAIDIEMAPDSYFLKLFEFLTDADLKIQDKRRELMNAALQSVDCVELFAEDPGGYADLISKRHLGENQ